MDEKKERIAVWNIAMTHEKVPFDGFSAGYVT